MENKNNIVNGLEYKEDLICRDNYYKEANLHQWGPGVREVYVLHFILSGNGFLEMEGKVHEIHPGDVFLIYPDTEVFYYPSEEDPWEYIWVDFSGAEATHLIAKTNFTKDSPVIREKWEVEPYFHIFDGENNPFVKRERYKAKMHVLLTYFYNNKENESRSKESVYFAMAKECIENNYWKSSFNITLSIDRTYLFRLFKKTTGMSIVQYLMEYRLKKACYLLTTTELSVKSISCSVGFHDPLYFSRVFHNKMHMTPTSYRNKVQLPLSR